MPLSEGGREHAAGADDGAAVQRVAHRVGLGSDEADDDSAGD